MNRKGFNIFSYIDSEKEYVKILRKIPMYNTLFLLILKVFNFIFSLFCLSLECFFFFHFSQNNIYFIILLKKKKMIYFQFTEKFFHFFFFF